MLYHRANTYDMVMTREPPNNASILRGFEATVATPASDFSTIGRILRSHSLFPHGSSMTTPAAVRTPTITNRTVWPDGRVMTSVAERPAVVTKIANSST